MAQDKVIEYWQIGIYGIDRVALREYADEFEVINKAIKMLEYLLKSAHSCPVQLALWHTIGQVSRIAYIVNKDGVFAYQKPTMDS